MRFSIILITILIVLSGFGCVSQQKREVKPVVNIAPADPYLCQGYGKAEDSEYILPYKEGERYKLIQGNCSRYSHFGTNRYAYDFGLPMKTEIIASRGGIVISEDMVHPDNTYSVKKVYRRTGKAKGNCILIQHSDGTIGVYYHLMQGSSTVNKGDRVKQGQLIALGGNSGFTTGAHLHFEVRKSKVDRQTVPITFRNASPGETFDLKPGNKYTALDIEKQEEPEPSFLESLF